LLLQQFQGWRRECNWSAADSAGQSTAQAVCEGNHVLGTIAKWRNAYDESVEKAGQLCIELVPTRKSFEVATCRHEHSSWSSSSRQFGFDDPLRPICLISSGMELDFIDIDDLGGMIPS
jgi:hypothetical protein